MNIYKKIYKRIKKADEIIIARHVGPDPDALGSSFALKEMILKTFPNKKVYTVGCSCKKFDFMGKVDKIKDINYNALLIVTDTPDKNRIDGVDASKFKNSIKIDHHPFITKTCSLEWIDESSSSACQMVAQLAFNTRLKLTDNAIKLLYAGIVADTNRFLFCTSSKTFLVVSKLLKSGLKMSLVYDDLYMRPLKEIKFYGYLIDNLKITENGVGYIKVTDDILKEYGVDAGTPGNMVNNFNHIDEALIWVTITEDKELKNYRISMRSRGPIINKAAEKFNGGGHIYACGARIKEEKINELLLELDECAKSYKK